MKSRISLVEILTVVALLFFIFMGSGATGLFVSEDKAIKALETQGFSNVKIESRAWFLLYLRGGEKSDSVRFTATARNPIGKEVTVYVFSGWLFKGATIRTP